MSGILGVFQRNGQPVAVSVIETMRQAMPDRGAAQSGVWVDGCVGLGQVSVIRAFHILIRKKTVLLRRRRESITERNY